jgi:hypothetical protein
LPSYRIYFLNSEGHVDGPPIVIAGANDEEARQTAKQYIDGKDIELWDGERMVAKIPHK